MIGLLLASVCLAGTPDVQPDLQDDRVRLATQLDVLDSLLENGMPEQALAMIGEMHQQGAKDVRMDVAEARAMHQRGLDHDAERLLLATVKKNPRTAEAWAQLGVLQADMGQVPAAVESLKKAARLDPKNPDIQNNYGFVLMAAGRDEDAVDAFRSSLAMDPASIRTRNNLGFVLVRLDRYDEAMESFRAASDEADARYNFAAACESHGDKAAAITNYDAAVRVRPGHPLAVAALSRILKESSP
ncbi:hypothetical protein LBMAG42_24020 [Deltaproteobacteria bacterium]|nr:hypothetical protein LBMAG42_24020 [Deltaproteobacteria bacterium]